MGTKKKERKERKKEKRTGKRRWGHEQRHRKHNVSMKEEGVCRCVYYVTMDKQEKKK